MDPKMDDDEQQLMQKNYSDDDDRKNMEDSGEDLEDQGENEPQSSPPTIWDKWEGVKFIWGREEIRRFNMKVEKNAEIRPVIRFDEKEYVQRFGIRAGPPCDWVTCTKSLVVPWHNEWLLMLFYLGFGLYFWIELILIMARSPQYKFRQQHDYDFMFLATLGFALSLSATFAYLTFYSVSTKLCKLLSLIDYVGKMVLVFLYTFSFIASELVGSNFYFCFMFFLIILLILNIVIIQYDDGRVVSFWTTLVVISLVYFYDFVFSSTPKQKEVFYIPLFMELLLVGTGFILFYFSAPERFCKRAKFVQLYLTGYIFFQLFLINFYYEAHNILYDLLKLNSGNYDDQADDWYRYGNVYNKD